MARWEVQTSDKFLIEGFDELNVMKRIKLLYKRFYSASSRAYRDLYEAKYKEVAGELASGEKTGEDDTIDRLAEMEVSGLLTEPHPVTHFAFEAETYRKRDRAEEAINSSTGNAKKKAELSKAVRLYARQTAWYADFVSDMANVTAMKKSGVKRVKWVTQRDGKVCSDCMAKDGKIYDIDKVPDKPHVRCRCYTVPYMEEPDGNRKG